MATTHLSAGEPEASCGATSSSPSLLTFLIFSFYPMFDSIVSELPASLAVGARMGRPRELSALDRRHPHFSRCSPIPSSLHS